MRTPLLWLFMDGPFLLHCFMAFYGRLVLEALFLLWLFMDDSFLKHSFFYGFLWTTGF
jgi:hypothetical protein